MFVSQFLYVLFNSRSNIFPLEQNVYCFKLLLQLLDFGANLYVIQNLEQTFAFGAQCHLFEMFIHFLLLEQYPQLLSGLTKVSSNDPSEPTSEK